MTTSMNPDTDENIIEVYVHTEGTPDLQLQPVNRNGHVRDLLTTDDPAVSDESIWLAEQDEPLDVEISLVDAGITERCHVHRGCCTSVKARVHYNGTAYDRSFSPATPVAQVYRWAAGEDGFKLPSEEIPRHALLVRGTSEFIDTEVHIGSLSTSPRCDVDFNLVPKKRFEG